MVSSTGLPVTQVSYNDAKAYCNWANKRLPTYDEYWELVKNDHRTIVSENILPISNVDEVNIIGNVWDITEIENKESVRLACKSNRLFIFNFGYIPNISNNIYFVNVRDWKYIFRNNGSMIVFYM